MKRKGIAIQTILLLLVGILVVGIIVYMVYRYMLTPGLTEQECRGMAVSWCTNCKNNMNAIGSACADWADAALCAGPTASSSLQTCASKYFSAIPGTDCVGSKGWCSSFIPV